MKDVKAFFLLPWLVISFRENVPTMEMKKKPGNWWQENLLFGECCRDLKIENTLGIQFFSLLSHHPRNKNRRRDGLITPKDPQIKRPSTTTYS